MREWKYRCDRFKDIRKVLKQYENAKNVPTAICGKILSELQRCIKDISRCYFKDKDLYNSWIKDISEDFDEDLDMETVNYRLEEFYDFCDDMEIFLPSVC